jgi:hypothetical protein
MKASISADKRRCCHRQLHHGDTRSFIQDFFPGVISTFYHLLCLLRVSKTYQTTLPRPTTTTPLFLPCLGMLSIGRSDASSALNGSIRSFHCTESICLLHWWRYLTSLFFLFFGRVEFQSSSYWIVRIH